MHRAYIAIHNYIYVYMRTLIHIHTYTHIHTHTHTYTHRVWVPANTHGYTYFILSKGSKPTVGSSNINRAGS